MIYIGDFKGYQVYQNDDGFLEAYKSNGVILQTSKAKLAKSSTRVVSNTSDLNVFISEFLTKKRKNKEPNYDPNHTGQTKLL